MLLHCAWTFGVHAYGDINNITNDPLNDSLIEKLTNQESAITSEDILSDQSFWSKEKRLNFLSKVSDILELKQIKHALAIENAMEDVFGLSWKSKLDPIIQMKVDIDSKKRRPYDAESAKHLLRLIRNLSHHYNELAPNVKAALGPVDTLADFWPSTFPLLLPRVYSAMLPFKADTNCARIHMFYC